MKTIRRFRKLKGWNQTMLAEAAGVEQSTISKIENGWDGITLRNLLQIAEALEIQPYQLFTDSEQEAEIRLLEIFRDLPGDRQKGWLEMAALAKADSQKEDQ